MKKIMFLLLLLTMQLSAFSQGVGQTVNYVIEARENENFTTNTFNKEVFYLEYGCDSICVTTRYYFSINYPIVNVVEEIYPLEYLEGVLNYMNINFSKQTNMIWYDYNDDNEVKLKINEEDDVFHILYKKLR